MFFRRKRTQLGRSVKVDQTQRQVEIPADAVRIGMRVVKLDRPWTEVPFLFQQFVVESATQLATLRQYCLGVTVELTEDQYRLQAEETKRRESLILKPLPEEKPLIQELVNARVRYREARDYIGRLLRDVATGQNLDLSDARSVVQHCVTSIMSNANAMFWLTRIRHEDAYTAEHCLRVGILAITFGRFLELPREDLETLGLCGVLHDIGKLRVPGYILNKPGPLTPKEMEIMRTHSQHGFELLGSHHQLAPVVRDAALSHHERMDGKGYPNGLTRSSISRFARIISVVDAYDAITSDRCYKKGLSTVDALRIIYRARGSHFDEDMVETFIRMIGVYPPGTVVRLSSGETAVILSTDPNRKLQPMVELVLDDQGLPCQPRVLRLADEPLDSNGCAYSISQALPDGIYGFTLKQHIERQTRMAVKPKQSQARQDNV